MKSTRFVIQTLIDSVARPGARIWEDVTSGLEATELTSALRLLYDSGEYHIADLRIVRVTAAQETS